MSLKDSGVWGQCCSGTSYHCECRHWNEPGRPAALHSQDLHRIETVNFTPTGATGNYHYTREMLLRTRARGQCIEILRERERCVASTHPRQNNPRVRNSALFMVRGCEASGRLSSKQDTSAAHHIHDSGQFQQGTDSVRSSEIRLTLTPVNHRGNISHLSLITLLIAHCSFSAPSTLLFSSVYFALL